MKKIYISAIITLIAALGISACSASKDQLKKDQATALRKLGEAYMAEDKDASAFQKLSEAEELNPKDPHTFFALGIFYFKKENYDLSIRNYIKCLELKADFAAARNNLGITYMAKGEYDKAIACFKELTNNYFYATPHYPLANLGKVYFLKKDYKNAEKYLLKSLEVNARFSFALHWLGKTYIELGSPFKAIESLEKAVSITPMYAEIYFDLGEAYAMASQKDKAIHAYRKVMEIEPDSPLGKRAERIVSIIER